MGAIGERGGEGRRWDGSNRGGRGREEMGWEQ